MALTKPASTQGTDDTTPTADVTEIDGRSLRRLRNREKVIDSYLELVAAGNRSPSIDDLAKYSGISFRSIYRYFESPTELVAAAAERGYQMFSRDLVVRDEGMGSLQERVERLVEQRIALYRRSAPFVAAARSTHSDDESVNALFEKLRSALGRQVSRHFDPELASLDHDQRRAKVAGIYFAFLYDGMRMLHDLYPNDDEQIKAVLVDHVLRHLGPAPALDDTT
ncbi:MAG: TetR/AcrR family transcriptional regulator [Actinomycetota bacterium]